MADLERLEKERQESIKYLSKPWRNFFSKFQEIEELEIFEWKLVHLLAYIDKRYREYYNKNFAYTCKRAPSKCTEIVLIKRMCAMLSTINNNTIKEYIDWVFDSKIIPKKMKIRTLAFFGTQGLGNEFFIYKEEKDRIYRSTELPFTYRQVVDELDLPVNTYGDLAFAKMVLNTNSGEAFKQQYKQLFNKLYAIGFEDNMIKDLV